MKEMKIERKEKWVQINKVYRYENVKDCYWISDSDEDKVMNRDTGKILKPGFDKDGYKMVSLRTKDRGKKTCYLHLMKAKAFLFGPNPLGYNVVRHLNDVKTNNALTNLAFGTRSDNNLDCIRNGNFNYKAAVKGLAKGAAKGSAITAKKLSKPVRCIETGEIFPSTREAGRRLGIHNAGISVCCNGRCKTFGGYHWEYINKEEVNNDDMECKQIR